MHDITLGRLKNPLLILVFLVNVGWGDEQIEGWRIMLERNVSRPNQFIMIIHSLGPRFVATSEGKDVGKTRIFWERAIAGG